MSVYYRILSLQYNEPFNWHVYYMQSFVATLMPGFIYIAMWFLRMGGLVPPWFSVFTVILVVCLIGMAAYVFLPMKGSDAFVVLPGVFLLLSGIACVVSFAILPMRSS